MAESRKCKICSGSGMEHRIPLFELRLVGAKFRDIRDFIGGSKGFEFDLYPEHGKFNVHRRRRDGFEVRVDVS